MSNEKVDNPVVVTSPLPIGDDARVVDYDGKLLKKIKLKCDLRLLPILSLIYVVSFLDRTNLANARLDGFERDLHMKSNGFNTAIWIFYLPFVLLEVPSNLVLRSKKLTPSQWIGSITFLLGERQRNYRRQITKLISSIGICTMAQGFSKTYQEFFVCRFLMGCFEAGLAPGIETFFCALIRLLT
jgi:MFS family permease